MGSVWRAQDTDLCYADSMSASARMPTHMSVADFLAWNSPAGQKWQLVDGEPQAMSPANRTHGSLQSELAWVLTSHFRATDRPYVAVTEPGIVPRALAANNVRIADLAVTCSGYESEEATLSDPVLIVEILSPSNAPETWTNVWAYSSIPSVREILVLHTAAMGADLLRRDADGNWPAVPTAVAAGDLVLETIGLTVPLASLYRTTRFARAG
jgi:Uma2 family endonuclease